MSGQYPRDILFVPKFNEHQLILIQKLKQIYAQQYNHAICIHRSHLKLTDSMITSIKLNEYLRNHGIKPKQIYEIWLDYIIPRVCKLIHKQIKSERSIYRLKFISVRSYDFEFQLRFPNNSAIFFNDYIRIPHTKDIIPIELLHNPIFIDNCNIRTLVFKKTRTGWIGIIRKIYKNDIDIKIDMDKVKEALQASDPYENDNFECPILR